VPGSSNSNEDLWHFCNLFCKLLRKKPRDNWILSFFALSILLYLILQESYSRHWAKMENKEQSATRPKIGRTTSLLALNSPRWVSKEKNRQRGTFARHQLALNSSWRVNKGKNRQKHMFARHGEWSYLGGEQGRLILPRMTWHKPSGEETSTRHGEQRNSRGELMQMGKLINSPWSFLERSKLLLTEKYIDT